MRIIEGTVEELKEYCGLNGHKERVIIRESPQEASKKFVWRSVVYNLIGRYPDMRESDLARKARKMYPSETKHQTFKQTRWCIAQYIKEFKEKRTIERSGLGRYHQITGFSQERIIKDMNAQSELERGVIR